MPSIVHNDSYRSFSRSSTAVNARQRLFFVCFRPRLVATPPSLLSSTAFQRAHSRGLVDASLGWRWQFLRHNLIQLRGLRIRKTLAPPRNEKRALPCFPGFMRLQIEPTPCSKEKSDEELERKTNPSLSRPQSSIVRDGSCHLTKTRWSPNPNKLVKLAERCLDTEEHNDRKRNRDREPRVRKVATARRPSSYAHASRMIHLALKEEQSPISAGIFLSEETRPPECEKQSEEVMLNSTTDSKSSVDGQDQKAGLVSTTSEWQRSLLPSQNCRRVYQTAYLSSGLDDGSIQESRPSDVKARFDFSHARSHTKVSQICLRTITAKIMNDGLLSEPWKLSSMDEAKHEDKVKLARLSHAEQAYLARSGYAIQDVNLWVDILSEKDSYRAARTIFENVTTSNSESADNMAGNKPVPSFVLRSFLGRTRLPAGAFRLVLIAVWHHMNRLTRERQAKLKMKITESRTDGLTFTLFARLLQHARKVMPASVVNVAAIVSTYLSRSSFQNARTPNSNTTRGRLARLTALYNRTLVLLSKPPSLNPMKSSALQERAQFDVLASMIDHQPPIELNREGWRAIIAVLLRRQKTKKERKWAELKSASWPPFKESRIGSDEQLTPNDGISRAHQAIKRMQEAGYSTTTWGRVATILSGWDTDGSPAIQTRGFISPRSIPSSADVWAARIKATRTLHEAWACFLSQDEESGRPGALVYTAMFEKIIFDHVRTQAHANKLLRDAGSRLTALPGDGQEVSAPPISPAEAVYTRSPPPPFETLFDRMLSDGIEPRGRLLALLLNHAPNVITAYKVINSCVKTYNGIIPKLIHVPHLSREEVEAASVPSYVLAAVIRFLCLAIDDAEREAINIRAGSPVIVPDWIMHKEKRVVHAFHLLKRLQPRYRPAWNHVLDGLSRLDLAKYLVLDHHKRLSHFNHILAAVMARQVISHMKSIQLELDAVGFRHLCICMEKAALSARVMVKGKESVSSKGNFYVQSCDGESQTPWFGQRSSIASPLEEAKLLLATGSQYLRTTFQELVGTASKDSSLALPVPDVPPIPKLLATPNPRQLHAYVRALGVLQDHEGILSLAQWMHMHHKELHKLAVEELGGQRRLQSVFVAMRAFLEQPDEDGMVQNVGVELRPANPELVELVAREVRAVQEWVDWPSNESVQAYLWPSIRRARNL